MRTFKATVRKAAALALAGAVAGFVAGAVVAPELGGGVRAHETRTFLQRYTPYNPLDPRQPELYDPATGLTIVPDPRYCHPLTNGMTPATVTPGAAQAPGTSVTFTVVWTCDERILQDAN